VLGIPKVSPLAGLEKVKKLVGKTSAARELSWKVTSTSQVLGVNFGMLRLCGPELVEYYAVTFVVVDVRVCS